MEAEAAQAALGETDAAARSAGELASQARAQAEQTQAEVDALTAAAAVPQPDAVPFSVDQIDVSRLSLDAAQASLAGPDSIYVSSIIYDGQHYSALLKYHGGSMATVERMFGPDGALIPASVDLSRTRLAVVDPDLLDISYVEVDGQGYSGQLRFAGDNRLEVVGIQRVTLPPTPMELVSAAEAAAADAVAEAHASAEAAVADAQAAAQAAIAEAEAAVAEAHASAEAAVSEAQAEAAAAQAKVDTMMADTRESTAATFSADRLDTSRLSFESTQAAVAGPDLIYVSPIMYDGQSYSALLKYQGGTTATVERIFGPNGRRIPTSVSLSQTELTFEPPDLLDISFVDLNGQGYSGQLRYAGDNRLEVTGIQRVTLPPTALEQVAAAEAAADAVRAEAAAAVSAAQAVAAAARAGDGRRRRGRGRRPGRGRRSSTGAGSAEPGRRACRSGHAAVESGLRTGVHRRPEISLRLRDQISRPRICSAVALHR